MNQLSRTDGAQLKFGWLTMSFQDDHLETEYKQYFARKQRWLDIIWSLTTMLSSFGE